MSEIQRKTNKKILCVNLMKYYFSLDKMANLGIYAKNNNFCEF